MNKILEFIRKHSKITVILIILCSLLPLIVVHILFKWNSGIAFLVAEWSAGELLGYIGTLLSFWGTIILGWLDWICYFPDKMVFIAQIRQKSFTCSNSIFKSC